MWVRNNSGCKSCSGGCAVGLARSQRLERSYALERHCSAGRRMSYHQSMLKMHQGAYFQLSRCFRCWVAFAFPYVTVNHGQHRQTLPWGVFASSDLTLPASDAQSKAGSTVWMPLRVHLHQVGGVPRVPALYHSGKRGRSAVAKARILTSSGVVHATRTGRCDKATPKTTNRAASPIIAF